MSLLTVNGVFQLHADDQIKVVTDNGVHSVTLETLYQAFAERFRTETVEPFNLIDEDY